MNSECLLTRAKIIQMFKNLTPSEVKSTKNEINPHLLVCADCKGFFERYSARKIEEYERSKKCV